MTQTTSPATQESPLRRTPRQKRSRERVAAILSSTAALLEESGYDDLTTATIAEHAGMSVSSLYQFFANVDAIITELVRGWTAGFDAIVTEVEIPTLETFPASLDAVVDRYAEFFRQTPGFRAVYFSGSLRGEARALDRQSNTRLALVLASRWAALLDRDVDAELEGAARVVVQIGDALLGMAFRIDRNGDDATLDEAKRAIRAYVRDRLPGLWTQAR